MQPQRSVPAVRRATQHDVPLVAEILGEAFLDDPIMRWIIPDDEARHRSLPTYFRMVAENTYLPHREVYLTEQGAALWLPPGASAASPPMLAALRLAWQLFRVAGFGGLRRANTVLSAMRANHPAEPHYYLHAVGTRCGVRGGGHGSALIRHVTDSCDRDKCLAYLENSNERNLPLYERNGFRVSREWRPPGGGPRLWFMVRAHHDDIQQPEQ